MILLCMSQRKIFFSVVFTNQVIHIRQGFQVRLISNPKIFEGCTNTGFG